MPKRKKTEQVKTVEVQGDDSWVVITKPTWAQLKEVRRQRKAILADKKLDAERQEEKLAAAGEEMLRQYVKDWNWVDDDDQPLPKPTEEGTIDLLTSEEVMYLTNLLNGNLDTKN